MRLECEWRHAWKRWAENLVISKKQLVEIWLWAGQSSWGVDSGRCRNSQHSKNCVSLSSCRKTKSHEVNKRFVPEQRRERHTFYYADCSYIAHSHPPPPAGLARPRVKSQLTAFSKSPNSQPIASRHNVIHTPVTFPTWVFLLWHLWLSHPSRTSVNCTQCVHLHVPWAEYF